MNTASADRLRELAGNVRKLPPLPSVYIRVVELMRNPRTSPDDLAKVVVNDQVIAAKLLQVLNSSFYGFRQRINTLPRAITVIGFRGLRDLILTISAVRVVRPWSAGRSFDDRSFWAHAVGCAACARMVAGASGAVDPEEAFTAALLHDIGKVALYWFLRDEFVAVAWKAQDANEPLYEAENREFEFNHADLGSLLAQRWKLPDELSDPISFHHMPGMAQHKKITAAVHAADVLSHAMALGGASGDRVPPLDNAAWESLNIDSASIEQVMRQSVEECEKAKEFLTILNN